MSECNFCGAKKHKTKEKLSRCSKCKEVYYCSRGCQADDWKCHGKVCGKQKTTTKKKKFGSGFFSRGASLYDDLLPVDPVLPSGVALFGDDCVNSDAALSYKGDTAICGLKSYGNTCYINCILQCMLCTKPLVGYIDLINPTSLSLNDAKFDILCELQKLITKRRSKDKTVLTPESIVKHLKLSRIQHEDAEEFLIFLFKSFLSSCFYGYTEKVDWELEETSLLHQLFGIKYLQQTKCLHVDESGQRCSYSNDVYQLDQFIRLDVCNLDEKLKQLEELTVPQLLEAQSGTTEIIDEYDCETCNNKSKCAKSMVLFQAPNILIIHIKRVNSFSSVFKKSNQYVRFDLQLDISKAVSDASPAPKHLLYDLYAVVVHLDLRGSSSFGHYVSYCRAAEDPDVWYCFDDEKVSQLDFQQVQRQNAYMLFYQKRQLS